MDRSRNDFDKILYLQCREYIKLYLLNEELHNFRDYDSDDFPLKLQEVIDDNGVKANLLLLEIYNSLLRLRKKE